MDRARPVGPGGSRLAAERVTAIPAHTAQPLRIWHHAGVNDKTLFRVAVAIASLCIVLALWLFALLADVLVMEITNDPDRFLAELDELGWQDVWWALVIDLAFPILYVLVSLLAIETAARLYTSDRLRSMGPPLRITPIVAGVCDLFENMFLLIAIGTGPNPPDEVATIPLYLSSVFSYVKWLGLFAVVLYAAPALAMAAWRALRRRGARGETTA